MSAAFELGERHGDFESLVRLANDPAHGSSARISAYLDRYGREFAFPLYEYYLAERKLRTLLEPAEKHRALLTEFLDSTDNDGLSFTALSSRVCRADVPRVQSSRGSTTSPLGVSRMRRMSSSPSPRRSSTSPRRR